MKREFYIFLFIIGIIASALSSVNAQWEGWNYRRTVTIDNTSGTALTDFQVKIDLSNLSPPFIFGHANSDGSDVRITGADGVTEIPFWIEEWDFPPLRATIWTKIPSIPTGESTIYLYYGNASPVIPPPDPVETPPSGPYTKNPVKIIPINVPAGRTNLLAENIVYDNVTGHYWMVLTDQTSGATVCLVYSDDPTNPSAWYWGGAVIPQAIAPHIMEYGGTWYIFYGDRSGSAPYPVSVATSSSVSGPYTKVAEVLQAGASGTWEDLRADEPYVFYRASDGKWILMYMGDAGGNVEQVGYAEADDILGPYTKFSGNPCIPFGPPGYYDAGTVADPWVYEYDGVYYIGYTVSPTTSSPWQTALATTTDWITFTKHGIILPLGGEWYSFRGAVTRIGDEYVFPYAGGASPGAYRLSLAIQPVYQAPPNIINNGDAVFDFFDGFDGTSIDLTKWGFASGVLSQTTVSGGLITLNATGTFVKIEAQSSFGMNYIGETRARHPNALESGMIVEYGFAVAGGFDLRITDNFPTFNRWQRYVGTSVADFGPPPDVNWHVLGLYRQSPGTAGFKIDNTVATVSTGVPTINLGPFLMSYGSGNQFIVDWTRVRKWAGVDPIATVLDEEVNPLPVELSSFSGSVIGSSVKLIWRTETEVNNYGFDIERKDGGRSSNTLNWEKIGFVNGNGNSNSPKNYVFEDKTVTAGKYSYRLKQIDNDGKFEYSKTIEIDFGVPGTYELSQNNPNPFNPTTRIVYQIPEKGNVTLKVFDMLGKEIATLVEEYRDEGRYEVEFNASEFSSGAYFYRIESGEFVETKKMILMK